MAQDYNVEDILEEIRRKKGDGSAGGSTYEDSNGTVHDHQSEPSRRVSRPDSVSDDRARSGSEQTRAPASSQGAPAERSRRSQEVAPEPARRQKEPAPELSPRAAERIRRGGEAYGNVAPIGSRRPDRRSAFAPHQPRENPAQEPVAQPRQTRYAAPKAAENQPQQSRYGGAVEDTAGGQRRTRYDAPEETARPSRPTRYDAPEETARPSRPTRYDAPEEAPSLPKSEAKFQVEYDPLTTKPSRRQFDFDAPQEDEVLPRQQRAPRQTRYDAPEETARPSRQTRYDAPEETARPSRPTRYDAPEETARPPRPARYDAPEETARPPRQTRYDAPEETARPPRPTRYDAPEDDSSQSKSSAQFQVAYDPLTTKPSRRQFDFDAPRDDETLPKQQRQTRYDAPEETARPARQARYDAPEEASRGARRDREAAKTPGTASQATGGFVLPEMGETAELPIAPKINYSPAAGGFGPEIGAVNGGGNAEAPRRRRSAKQEEPRGAGAENGYARRRPPASPDAAEGGYTRRRDPASPDAAAGESYAAPRRRPARSPNAQDDTLEVEGNLNARPRRRVMRDEADGEGGEIVRSHWQDSYNAQEELEDEPPEDDFGSPEDAPYVAKDIKAIQVGLNAKLLMMAVLSFFSIYLAMSVKAQPFAEALGVPNGLLVLPEMLLPEKHMQTFLIANIVIVAIAAIVCSSIVGGGIAALCKLHANSDSPAALAVLGVLTQGVVLAVSPDTVMQNDSVSLYFCVALVALLFNLIGKKLLIARVSRNFEFITSEGDKYALLEIRNRELSREFARGLGPDADRVAYSARTDFLTGFLDKSYASDYSESFSGIVVPITLFGAVAVAVVTYFLTGKNLPSAISAFAAVLCICAPFSSAVVPHQMLNTVSKKLTPNGAMLAGYESAEDYSDIGSVIIDDTDLFFPENIMLHGMKVFAEKRIDDAILDAASVILSCGGIMSGVFLNMIGGNRGMLKKVDSLMYEDGMGLSAWVDGKRVLIGSNELMQHHGIDCPSRDFENRYVRDGRRVLYLANTGELTAMFVLSYNPAADTAEKLLELQRRGVGAIVYTTDPNVTGDLIASVFGIRRSGVRVLPAKMHPEHTLLVRPKERVRADGAHSGTLGGVMSLLRASTDVKNSVTRGTVVQLIGLIVGYGLIAFMSFTGSLRLASYGTLLVYLLAWLIITSIACAAKKK